MTASARVAGLLLAAGAGRRLGRPKALVEFCGATLLDRGVRLLRTGGCGPVVVVSGAAPLDPPELPQVTVRHNPDWAEGMASSLRTGLAALAEVAEGGAESGAAVVALVDQPLIGPEAVARLIRAHAAGAGIAVAGYGGRPRNPVLLAREHWAAVAAGARGDAGARPFLRARPELVTLVPCDGTGSPDDIDTPEDLARLSAAG
ncbi:nucleotidyltransferase family protein [Allonocardiopsis opalescens]|uniref:Nicotine blue oxidoreductase n=1 Tax=Allonocardiopsis opalescens TaxID=1144618 RepID=A0A2T0Q3S1_9ACTN|nr:NTP transferase domain-containing protein [Allonocardiopsis opalescens]PRX98452.1 nicotine blue oxidoreductase [Allonocardiopsis opalescens]